MDTFYAMQTPIEATHLPVISSGYGCATLCKIGNQLHVKDYISYNVDCWHVVRDPQNLQIYLIISSDYGQACQK